MSKNSKNRQRTVAAKEQNRRLGFVGPKRTVTKHGKKNSWWMIGKFAPTSAAA